MTKVALPEAKSSEMSPSEMLSAVGLAAACSLGRVGRAAARSDAWGVYPDLKRQAAAVSYYAQARYEGEHHMALTTFDEQYPSIAWWYKTAVGRLSK
jgi:hypothetical protein